jgi:hypothetical protein
VNLGTRHLWTTWRSPNQSFPCATVTVVELMAVGFDPTMSVIVVLLAGYALSGYVAGRLLAASGNALLAGTIVAAGVLLTSVAMMLPALILVTIATSIPTYVLARRRIERVDPIDLEAPRPVTVTARIPSRVL